MNNLMFVGNLNDLINRENEMGNLKETTLEDVLSKVIYESLDNTPSYNEN